MKNKEAYPGYKRFWLAVLSFVFLFTATRLHAETLCADLFKNAAPSALISLTDPQIKKEIFELYGEGAKARALFSVENFFSESYINELEKQLPKGAGIDVFSNGGVDQRIARKDEIMQPLIAYANEVVRLLNEQLPPPERGRLEISLLKIVQSDGTLRQMADRAHIDTIRYISSFVNLRGEGTLYDADIPTAAMTGENFTTPKNLAQLKPGQGLIVNGGVRHALIAGQAAYPNRHLAPNGIGKKRLGLVLFIAPIGMNEAEVSNAIRRRPSTPDSVRQTIELARKRYLGPN